MMDAEKLALRRRIDALDEYATRLHAALTEAERENARLKAELETVKRERDAAVRDMKYVVRCTSCKHRELTCVDEPCLTCANTAIGSDDAWEWRGLCAENGGAEDA